MPNPLGVADDAIAYRNRVGASLGNMVDQLFSGPGAVPRASDAVTSQVAGTIPATLAAARPADEVTAHVAAKIPTAFAPEATAHQISGLDDLTARLARLQQDTAEVAVPKVEAAADEVAEAAAVADEGVTVGDEAADAAVVTESTGAEAVTTAAPTAPAFPKLEIGPQAQEVADRARETGGRLFGRIKGIAEKGIGIKF